MMAAVICCEVSESFGMMKRERERTGDAAEVPPLGVRTPPWKTG
jgi:hypothetical protein